MQQAERSSCAIVAQFASQASYSWVNRFVVPCTRDIPGGEVCMERWPDMRHRGRLENVSWCECDGCVTGLAHLRKMRCSTSEARAEQD